AAGRSVPAGRRATMCCAACDYPLFWVTPPRSLEDDDDTGDMVLRRRPGAAGIRLPATVPCPACRELNLLMEGVCLRCGSPMQPEAEPDPVVVPEPPPPPPPEPAPEQRAAEDQAVLARGGQVAQRVGAVLRRYGLPAGVEVAQVPATGLRKGA